VDLEVVGADPERQGEDVAIETIEIAHEGLTRP
jgi:hypothetical protein